MMPAIAIILPTILGFLFVSIILRKEKTPFLEKLCLGYPIGMGILTMQMFILGLLRIPLTQFYTSLPVGIEIIALSLFAWKTNIPFWGEKLTLSTSTDTTQKGVIIKAIIIALSIWICAKIGSIFMETYLRPIWAWDAWANWSASAKIFYYSKGLLLDAPPDEFFGKNIVIRLISYPLHNQLMQVWMALWSNGFDDVLVKFWSPFYLLSMAVYLYIFSNQITNKLISLTIVVIFLSSPLMSYHSVEVYSDLLLGSYIFFATASFINVIKGKYSYLPLIGIFCAIAMFTKDESLFFALPLLLSAIVFLWKNKRQKKEIALLLIPMSYIIPWYVFKFSQSLTIGAETIKFDLLFHPEVLLGVIFQFLSLQNFNVIFLFFPLLVLISRPPKEFLYLLLPLLCYICFFIIVYAFTTYYYDHFNRGTVFYRNVLTYYPSIILLTSLLTKNLIEHLGVKARDIAYAKK